MLISKRFPFVLTYLVSIVTLVPSGVKTTCVMDYTTDKKGNEANERLASPPTTDVDSCNDACIADSSCVAAHVSGVCFHWSDPNDVVSSPGDNIYVKNCISDTTTTTAAAATTTTPTITPAPSCSMNPTSDTDASDPQVEITGATLEMCQLACKVVLECKFFVLIPSSDMCKLYVMSSVTSSTQSGHTMGTKKECDDGKECCFDTTSNKGISETPTLSLTATQSSCEILCLSLETCIVSVFTGTSCKIFTQSPVTSSTSGVTLSTKNCPQGASAGSLEYTDTCSSASNAMFFPTLFFLLAVYLICV